jgi:hypothetical protein
MARAAVPNEAFLLGPQVGVVTLAFGDPGDAKTASVRCLAEEAKRRFLHEILSQKMPEDIGGYPAVREMEFADGAKEHVMLHVKAEAFVRAMHEPSVILFDELTNVGRAMQAAALEVINNPPPNCWVFACANPVEIAADGHELSAPTVNRLCIMDWESDDDSWLRGMEDGFQFKPPVMPLVSPDWMTHATKWGVFISAFIKRKPELLRQRPKDLSCIKPFPSKRAWHNAGKMLAAADDVESPDIVRHQIVKGCCGEGVAAEFMKWVTEQGLPDPEMLLADPSNLKLPRNGDLAIAILASVVGAVARKPTAERYEAGMDLIEVAFEQRPEVAVSQFGVLFKNQPKDYKPKNRTSKAAKELADLVIKIHGSK